MEQMKRKTVRKGNGLDRSAELLQKVVDGLENLRKEVRSGFAEVRLEIQATNARLDQTNARIEHLIGIIAPKLKDHDDRLERLESRPRT